jgi:hypothetical protein
MAQRILIELALFLIPFIIFFAYRAASKNMSVKDRWPLTILIVAGAVLASAGLLIKAMSEKSDNGLCYQAPRYENRVYIEGKKVPCDEVVSPVSQGATSAARDNDDPLSDVESTGSENDN